MLSRKRSYKSGHPIKTVALDTESSGKRHLAARKGAHTKIMGQVNRGAILAHTPQPGNFDFTMNL